MPATEFVSWQAYFSIYPFSVERQELQAALVAERITNSIGKLIAFLAKRRTYNPVDINTFLPDYLGTREKPVTEKSIEQQRAEYLAFKARWDAAQQDRHEPRDPHTPPQS